jgi:hypothetical protein
MELVLDRHFEVCTCCSTLSFIVILGKFHPQDRTAGSSKNEKHGVCVCVVCMGRILCMHLN